MLTSITTTTTTTTTTTATAVGGSSGAVFGALGVMTLIILLIAKELLSAYRDERGRERGRAEEADVVLVDTTAKTKSLATNLSAAIYPLLFSFALIVVVKVLEVL
jgi:hypothetical protein